MKTIIIINGPGGCGKNTFIKICRLYLQNTDYGNVYSYSSIFPIKKYMVKNGMWDGKSEKTEEVRKQMAGLKKQLISDGDKPLKYLFGCANKVNAGLVFFHIREASEIEKVVKSFKQKYNQNVYTIHLYRSSPTLKNFNSGVDLISQTMEYKNYDYFIDLKKDGFEYMSTIIKDFLVKKLNLTNISSQIDLSLLNTDIHKEFDDEANAGYI